MIFEDHNVVFIGGCEEVRAETGRKAPSPHPTADMYKAVYPSNVPPALRHQKVLTEQHYEIERQMIPELRER